MEEKKKGKSWIAILILSILLVVSLGLLGYTNKDMFKKDDTNKQTEKEENKKINNNDNIPNDNNPDNNGVTNGICHVELKMEFPGEITTYDFVNCDDSYAYIVSSDSEIIKTFNLTWHVFLEDGQKNPGYKIVDNKLYFYEELPKNYECELELNMYRFDGFDYNANTVITSNMGKVNGQVLNCTH